MQLPQEEADYFFSLFKPLLVYTNQKFQITPGIKKPEDIERYPFESTVKIRDKLYQNPELFDRFIQENTDTLSPENISIIQSWKGFIPGKFFVFRYLKKYTVFLTNDEPPKAYGVLSLYSPFEEIVGSSLPRLVETVLLPFKDKIVSDGIFKFSNIFFVRGVQGSLKENYELAKTRFGIITSLTASVSEIESPEIAKLKTYLKSQKNLEEHWDEIRILKEKSSEIKHLYYQEVGKIYAKKYSKQWREIGLNDVWFAFFEAMPIASGKTQVDVERTVKQILPKPQQKFVYYFHLKGK
ncbi:hypothetical protein H6G97_43905 [Nostoc flagelliforme FACHB-838]|uniref:Uncharacterized protein n=1 Tax=Nostoc flagelliforme FACHB-838 TaxID=2692904 RepID=A0ABR8E399_9NOSO|nr:hypothetical protein [Nostoc flagelliforme]MBD2535913.1 hypothetical protein [Nostoc flagelliforme FACHB-838]